MLPLGLELAGALDDEFAQVFQGINGAWQLGDDVDILIRYALFEVL